ncbi:MAG: hypothetical protein KF715_01090 [Candidatus Didemnitutus sp.]|nr:hypothetical protein [Candidatus Didemnitutus sp.]
MSAPLWAQVHGATVHFPIALVFFALFGDSLAQLTWRRPSSGTWLNMARYTVIAAAVSCWPPLVSGLWLTRGNLWGHGALRWHHLFLWPMVALLTGLAVWRQCRPLPVSRRAHLGHLVLLLAIAGLVAATGHWGGQLSQSLP